MCCLGAKNADATEEFMKSFKKYVMYGNSSIYCKKYCTNFEATRFPRIIVLFEYLYNSVRLCPYEIAVPGSVVFLRPRMR